MRSRRYTPPPTHKLRTFVFVAIATITLSTAGYLLFLKPRVGAEDAAEGTLPVTITMAGFSPATIEGVAGAPLAVTLVNPDGPHHTDGGGWHNFVLEALGVSVRVAPESVETFSIPGAPPGEYRWYCDICCGGNANPSMWGTLVVRA